MELMLNIWKLWHTDRLASPGGVGHGDTLAWVWAVPFNGVTAQQASPPSKARVSDIDSGIVAIHDIPSHDSI